MASRDRTLYLHVGFSKTASTWLQANVFPELSNIRYLSHEYISNQLKLNGMAEEGCTSLHSPFNLSPAFWSAKGEAFLLSFLDANADDDANASVLVSDENVLLGRGFFQNQPNRPHPYVGKDPYLFIEHVRQIRLLLEKIKFDTIKVIVCIRKQDDWLASRYAQSSAFIKNASQADFEKQIDNLLFDPGIYYRVGLWTDYYRLYCLLAELIGSDNLLFLPFELLTDSPRDFVERISSFTDSKFKAEIGNNKKNIRRLGSGREHAWALRGKVVTLRPRLFWRRIPLVSGRFEIGPFFNRKISLHGELSNKIMQSVRISNHKLDQELLDDLRQFKYY